MIEEGDEEEECDSSDEDNTGLHSDQMPASAILIQPADIPQAFSHFTYRHTQRKMLVCDLQGVYNEACSPPLFELTDPVIHFKSSSGRSNVFGRTDQGHKGIQSFFKTHKCSALCHALNKTWLPDERPVAALAQRMSEAWL